MTEEERHSLAEHWVLEYVVDCSMPADDFGAASDEEFTARNFIRLRGGLGVVDVREALVRLAAEGAVLFKQEGVGTPPAGPLTESALRSAIRGRSQPTSIA